MACGILVPQQEMNPCPNEPMPREVEAAWSLNPWTAREVPPPLSVKNVSLCLNCLNKQYDLG